MGCTPWLIGGSGGGRGCSGCSESALNPGWGMAGGLLLLSLSAATSRIVLTTGDFGKLPSSWDVIDFIGGIVRVVSSRMTFLGTGSPNRFTLGVFFSFKGAEICRGVKRGMEGAFFSCCLVGEGGFGGVGVGAFSATPDGFSEANRVFLRGMLNSRTASIPLSLAGSFFRLGVSCA